VDRVFGLGARGATDAKGSRIGLALVRLIVELAGGRVEVEDSDSSEVARRTMVVTYEIPGKAA
jgi:signal transduction histidine kinase